MNFRRLGRGIAHLARLFGAMLSKSRRALLQRMVVFSRQLPAQFSCPLPDMMAGLTPAPLPEADVSPDEVRHLADAVAAWHIRSPLGICLRRSLLRYYFLREANVPVRITYGARLKNQAEGGGIGGHAWLLFNGKPYYESPENYEGFVQLYTYPGES